MKASIWPGKAHTPAQTFLAQPRWKSFQSPAAEGSRCCFVGSRLQC